MWNKFIANRWLTALLLLSIFPLLLFGAIIYHIGSGIIEAEIHRSSKMTLAQIKDQVDQITQQAEDSAAQFSFQSNVLDFTDIGSSPPLGSLLLSARLMNDISSLKNSIRSLDSIYLYHFRQNIVITSGKIVTVYEQSFPDNGWIAPAEEAVRQKRQSFWIAPRTLKEVGAEKKVFTYIRILPPFHTEPNAALVINVDARFIHDMVQSFPLGSDGKLLVYTDDGELITQAGEARASDASVIARLLSSKSAQLSANNSMLLNDLSAYATLERSEVRGWNYALLIDSNVPTEKVRLLKQVVLALSVLLSLFSLLTAYFSFQRFQRGVRRILELLTRHDERIRETEPDLPGIPYDARVQSIETRISSLLEEVDVVRARWKEQLPLLRSHYLLSAIVGGSGAMDALSNYRKQTSTEAFDYPTFAVLVVEMDEPADVSRFGPGDEPLFINAVSNIASELLHQYRTETIFAHASAVIILNFREATLESEILQAAELLRQAIKKYLKQTVSIGVGPKVDSFSHLSASYRDAVQAMHLYRTKAGDEVVRLGYNRTDEIKTIHYPSHLEQELTDRFRIGDRQGVAASLEQFERYYEAHPISLSLMRTFFLQLLVTAIRILQEYDQELEAIFPDRNPYTEFLQLERSRDMQMWLQTQFFDPAIRFLETLRKRKTKETVAYVLDYIHRNYSLDLAFKTLADELGISQSYLSQLFKEEIGETYTDYLTKYRVGQIKKLLLKTELTIAEIAKEVGYGNAQQLIRAFKKLEQTTPGGYRASHKQ
ncbi:MAG: transcriptional regulator, AraC family [Paenibacillus sp.]|nr:transcriptional regulator, AraC family [Paenibacillus sp.]